MKKLIQAALLAFTVITFSCGQQQSNEICRSINKLEEIQIFTLRPYYIFYCDKDEDFIRACKRALSIKPLSNELVDCFSSYTIEMPQENKSFFSFAKDTCGIKTSTPQNEPDEVRVCKSNCYNEYSRCKSECNQSKDCLQCKTSCAYKHDKCYKEC
jgi:hypothetical protein